jgi:hypothetical protein
MRALLAYTIAFAVLLATPAMAQWIEQGDAGELPATAQIPVGVGALTSIRGNCGVDDADMYCIQVDDARAFVAATCTASWDTQLFILAPDGVGVKTNDDFCGLQSTVSDLASCGAGAGQFYIAISRFNKDPRDAANVAVFSTSNGCNTNTNSIAQWSSTSSTAGDYVIDLTAVSYCDGGTPVEPSTWGNIKGIYR